MANLMYLFAIKERGLWKSHPFTYINLQSSYQYWPENSYSCQLEIIYTEVEVKHIQIKQVSSQGERYEVTSDSYFIEFKLFLQIALQLDWKSLWFNRKLFVFLICHWSSFC